MLRDVATVSTPAWVSEAVVYQIFPDRFRRSGRVKAQSSLVLQPWGTSPQQQGFQGGDLYGVIEALDHLQELGVTCLYLTPVFSSAANHRYHAYDYFQVDPLLGGDAALDALIRALHGRGMRLILDGVFNHCGRGFWAFHHLLENGPSSPYRDWFTVHRWPLIPYPRKGQSCGYSCWWNDPALPKFNHANPAVHDHLLAAGRHWLERGIDGWRLDVPDEVPHGFWVDFRGMVKAVNPNAWIVGEIWGDARPWLQGDQFDGVMNYRLGWSSLCWAAGARLRPGDRNPMYPLNRLNGEEWIACVNQTLGWYSPKVNGSQLNLLDSHDVPRALHTLRGDANALRLALLLLCLQPGAPCLYYGTEVGLSGGPEPGCREAYPWSGPVPQDLQPMVKDLLGLRRSLAGPIADGWTWCVQGDEGLLGRSRHSPTVSVLINRSRRRRLACPENVDSVLWEAGTFHVNDGVLAPQSAVVFSSVPGEGIEALVET